MNQGKYLFRIKTIPLSVCFDIKYGQSARKFQTETPPENGPDYRPNGDPDFTVGSGGSGGSGGNTKCATHSATMSATMPMPI